MYKKILFALFLGFTVFTVQSQETSSFYNLVKNPTAMNAIGGRHAAAIDGYLGMYQNPASIAVVDPEFNIASVDLNVGGPVFSMLGIYLQIAGGQDMTSVLASPEGAALLSNLYASLDLKGPLAFGFVGNGIGFGINMTTDVTFKTGGALNLELQVVEVVDVRGGYAMRLDLSRDVKLDLGFMFKGLIRGESNTVVPVTDLLSGSIPDLFGQPFTVLSGVSLDTGAILHAGDRFSIGLTVYDTFAPLLKTEYASLNEFMAGTGTPASSNVYVPQDVSVGLKWSIPLGVIENYIESVDLYFDYNDIFDFALDPANSDNVLLKMSTGVDMSMFSVLNLRAGFNRGLFTSGLRLDLNYFIFNFVMYGMEYGPEPGLNPVFNFGLSLDFRY